MESIKRFFRRSVFVYKSRLATMNWKTYILFTLFTPVLQMTCYSIVAKYANGGRMEKWFIANALVLTFMSTIYGAGTQLSRERNLGTLRLIIASPSSLVATYLPRNILWMLEGVLNILTGFAFGFIFFGFNITLSQLSSLLILSVLASFAVSGFAVIISSLALLTRDLNLLVNVASMLLLGLTGANFPLERLPSFMRFVPDILPLTRTIKLSRYVIKGESILSHFDLVIEEIILGIILTIVGLILFKIIERIAIKQGTLDLV